MSILNEPGLDSAMKNLVDMIADPDKPSAKRAEMMLQIVLSHFDDKDEMHKFLKLLLNRMDENKEAAKMVKFKAQYEQMIHEMQNGPLHAAVFIGKADAAMPGPKNRIDVVLADGHLRSPLLHESVDADDLEPGMTVYIDPKGTMALAASKVVPRVGQVARFERWLPDGQELEVTFRDEKLVLYASQQILDAEADGKLSHNDNLLFCPTQRFAFSNIPADADRRHRFVDDAKIPNIDIARDIGQPHWILGWMLRRLQVMLYRPDIFDQFHCRQRSNVAMIGPSGSGKTLTTKAFISEFNKELIRFTGRNDLGSRVVRAKTSDLFSPWFGQSDINIDSLFSDIEFLAAKKVETSDGRKVRLPVIIILEEAEGMGRRRGENDGGVYDRIIGMLLQRLDDTTDDLGQLPLFFLTTSNRPDMLDAAMWRRLAGVKALFSRLGREGLAAVLDKKLAADLPYASNNGTPKGQLRRDMINRIVTSMFSPNGDDRELVEITLRDGQKINKYRRDFLTGAVVEQAVSNAIDLIAFEAYEKENVKPALCANALLASLEEVIDGLAGNLTAANAADYVDLPENSLVAGVRRFRLPRGSIGRMVYN